MLPTTITKTKVYSPSLVPNDDHADDDDGNGGAPGAGDNNVAGQVGFNCCSCELGKRPVVRVLWFAIDLQNRETKRNDPISIIR